MARQAAKSGSAALASRIVPRLRPPVAPKVKARAIELTEAFAEAGFGKDLDALLARNAKLAPFLAGVLDYAPFLRALVLDNPGRALALLSADPDERLKALVADTGKAWRGADEETLMATLRRARQEAALLIALADLGGVWDVVAVTAALTAFADAAIGAAVRFILADTATKGQVTLAKPSQPEMGCGWILLAMGKYGAGELNYSSDIDLIVLYDAAKVDLKGAEPAKFYVTLTKRLVHILHDFTADSYVFRVDLRLRPDPGATQIAISAEAALQYYESLGQNWERAALIKARAVAGDVAAGEAFLAELTPYIWRKYLDYAAIADIHSIKRQIHDHRGHAEVAVAGHNIKLGRGGIREIEFFVQTQQLIAGGRNPELRGRRTLDTLAALAATGWIDRKTADSLARAYGELRTVEHCLQMIADEQTHTLPDEPEGLATVAAMAGYASRSAFEKALPATLATVRDHYAALFEAAPALGSAHGSLVFTGDADDPGTVDALARLGFEDPSDVIRTVRGWHFGRYPAMRSTAARERLTEITPALLKALARTDNAGGAFKAFDRFLARMPAGVQLFALLGSNPGLLDLLTLIMGTAPRLAETVIQRAHVLDALIEPAFFGRVPDRAMLEKRLAASLADARDYEDVLNRARVFGQEQGFLIGVRVLAGTLGPRAAGHAFADLADVLVAALFDAVRAEFELAHGRMRGGRVVVVALGKLGSREMTAASDLDLILLYDFDDKATASDGKRPLPGGLYFARLTQRLVAALSAPTAEGTLYQVDFRLRPSGNSGPLATHIDAFVAYQAKEAWTWEHMALTRARPIAGDDGLRATVAKRIRAIVAAKRERGKLVKDVLEMRGLIEEAKGGEGAWDLKIAAGGMVDIEFVTQFLELLHAAKHPRIVANETESVLGEAARAGVLRAREAEVLLPALRLYQALTQVLRLCVDGPFRPAEAPRGLLALLARAGEMPDFATLDRHVRDSEEAVRASFERVIADAPKK